MDITTTRARSGPLYVKTERGTISLIFETQVSEMRSRFLPRWKARSLSASAVYSIGEDGVNRYAIKDRRRLLVAALMLCLAFGAVLSTAVRVTGRYASKRRAR